MISLKFVTHAIRGAGSMVSGQVNAIMSKGTIEQSRDRHVGLSQPSMRGMQTSSPPGGFLSQASKLKSMGLNPDARHVDVELPEKPKKPLLPWLAFVRDRKDDVLRQQHKMTASQLSVILSKEWRNMDQSNYREKYDREYAEYQRQLREYEKSLTEEHKKFIDYQRALRREAKTNRLLKMTKPPVLPRNPANLFCHERSKQTDVRDKFKYQKATQVFSEIFKEYRELSEDEKKKYIDMQEEDKSRFQHEFFAWYESIQNDQSVTKKVLEKAEAMRARYRSLNYI